MVEIDGQRVVDGSTISAAGNMIVTSNLVTSLYVDGVAWQPIRTTDNTKEYVVSSGGRFVIYDEQGRLLMSFINQYDADFSFIGYNRVYFYNSEGGLINRESSNRAYVQTTVTASNGRYSSATVVVELEGDYRETQAALLDPSTNQGSVSKSVTADKITINIADYNPRQILQVKLGNVLTAFVYPR